MHKILKSTIRWGSYPVIAGICAVAQLTVLYQQLPYWPLAPLISVIGIVCVALLERVQPYQRAWLSDHDDTLADVLHAFTSLSLIFLSIEIVELTREFLPVSTLWPDNAPLLLQVVIVGLIIDFGLWAMHWLSHKNLFLWKLHALHHSSERLYWLNGERRHPLSALALAIPGISVAVMLGAPANLIGTWLSIVAVHLAFQHANLDYRLGIFCKLLAVAEIHRWHHKREYEDAQVNYGEFWLIWDHLFGTFRNEINTITAGEVGMRDEMPTQYLAQMKWPFSQSASNIKASEATNEIT